MVPVGADPAHPRRQVDDQLRARVGQQAAAGRPVDQIVFGRAAPRRPARPGRADARPRSCPGSRLAAAGFSAAEVVQLRLYVTDIGAYYGAQQAFVERFSARGIPVAATLIGVTGLAMPELLVEIDALAVG